VRATPRAPGHPARARGAALVLPRETGVFERRCHPCDHGSFAAGRGAARCLPCAAGTAQDKEGQVRRCASGSSGCRCGGGRCSARVGRATAGPASAEIRAHGRRGATTARVERWRRAPGWRGAYRARRVTTARKAPRARRRARRGRQPRRARRVHRRTAAAPRDTRLSAGGRRAQRAPRAASPRASRRQSACRARAHPYPPRALPHALRIPPGDRDAARRVRLVRKEGRDVSSWYGREGGGRGGGCSRLARRGMCVCARVLLRRAAGGASSQTPGAAPRRALTRAPRAGR